MAMDLDINKVHNLISADFNGNISNFCRELNLDYSGVWKVLNGKSTGSTKFIPALFQYCKQRNVEFDKFVH